jgi:pimeloyl-ACP methyl ester carboxylesterase
MKETLRQALPRIYDRILPAFFDADAPEEPKATCHDCAMCPTAEATPGVIHFRRDTKCCTYQPHLPNYLVGAILADTEPAMAEGQRRVRAHIEGRVGVTARWLAPSRKRSALFRAARDASFGRTLTLRCPYYVDEAGGLCSIWRHRESVCSTFFCKYDAGADGQAFWRALNDYLRHVERALVLHVVDTLAPSLAEPPRPFDQMSLEELEDQPPTAADYASFWGAWQGREEAFYLEAHALVAGLSRDAFDRIVGAAPAELAAVEAALRRVREPVLPRRLALDLYQPPIEVPDGVIVSTYSKYEPIKLTPALFEVLRELRPDETVDAFRARLLRDHEVDVPEAMLLSLHQLRVLIEPA